MRRRMALAAVALGTVSAGCGTLGEDLARNVTEAPLQAADECRPSLRDRQFARAAWLGVRGAHANQPYAPDYADGFQAGFAEYLDVGGNGQPPSVPPFRYRRARYQTPEGHQAIEEWFDGYREGAAAAQASGLREQNVIPLSAPPINAVAAKPGAAAPPVPPETAPELPPPRPVGPAAPAPPPSPP